MLVIWQILVPLPNSHTWERRNGQTRGSTSTITWLYRGSLLCLPSEAAHLSAHFTVSLPQHPGMLLCETLSQQSHSSVVQSQRMHRDELIKRSGRSICLSLVPTPGPCFWNAAATLWKYINVSQAFRSPPNMYSWHFSCLHFLPVFYLGAKNLRKRIIMQMHGLWFLLMITGPVQIRSHNAWLCAKMLSRLRLFVAPWSVTHQAPLSMEFSRQEYCNG